jgi:hypothetical protein
MNEILAVLVIALISAANVFSQENEIEAAFLKTVSPVKIYDCTFTNIVEMPALSFDLPSSSIFTIRLDDLNFKEPGLYLRNLETRNEIRIPLKRDEMEKFYSRYFDNKQTNSLIKNSNFLISNDKMCFYIDQPSDNILSSSKDFGTNNDVLFLGTSPISYKNLIVILMEFKDSDPDYYVCYDVAAKKIMWKIQAPIAPDLNYYMLNNNYMLAFSQTDLRGGSCSIYDSNGKCHLDLHWDNNDYVNITFDDKNVYMTSLIKGERIPIFKIPGD